MIRIEPITKSELTDLAELYNDLFLEKTNLQKMQETFDLIQSNTNHTVLGAKINGLLVGSLIGYICPVMLGQCKPFMFIESVIVSNDYRKHGIGKMLMSEIERIARKHNCFLIQLVSSSHRTEAHQFYETLGYDAGVKGFRKILI